MEKDFPERLPGLAVATAGKRCCAQYYRFQYYKIYPVFQFLESVKSEQEALQPALPLVWLLELYSVLLLRLKSRRVRYLLYEI